VDRAAVIAVANKNIEYTIFGKASIAWGMNADACPDLDILDCD
jgi:hypothetical protein